VSNFVPMRNGMAVCRIGDGSVNIGVYLDKNNTEGGPR